MPGVVVDGNDVIAVFETVSEAVNRARRGDGPTLVESKTYPSSVTPRATSRIPQPRGRTDVDGEGPDPRFANLLKEKGWPPRRS